MAGSNLKINNPSTSQKHDLLTNRNIYGQHVLEAIYRLSDGKDLATILNEINANDRTVLWDRVTVTTDGQRLVEWDAFECNMTRDVLFVQLCGTDVYEGTDVDFVKTSPNSITFNYDLKSDYEVVIVLAGTISLEGFGDDVFNGLTQFRQLTDTPKAYYGHGNEAVFVNDAESGLVFKPVSLDRHYISIEDIITVGEINFFEKWLPFINNGSIQSIKLTPETGYLGDYSLSIWTDSLMNEWVYYSGMVTNILYDIMTIPHIDTTGQNQVYIRISNSGPATTFKLKIMILE